MRLTDIAWVAGILEGEGSFYLHDRNVPVITVSMTDHDIITRVARILGKDTSIYITNQNKQQKPTSVCTIRGLLAIQWMMTIYKLMGKRRQSKIRELINYWKSKDYRKMGVRDSGICSRGHLVEGNNAIVYGNFFLKCKKCNALNKKQRRAS